VRYFGFFALSFLTLVACESQKSAPAASTEAPASTAVVPDEVPTTPPKLVSKVAPDFSGFPGGHIPSEGGRYILVVDESGLVTDARPEVPGHPRVDAAILAALRQWRFEPATRGGAPVAVEYPITINLSPDRQGKQN
jgi:protein TonB